MDRETVIEDRVCAMCLLAIFLALFVLTADLTKLDASFAPPIPTCAYNCR